MSIKWCELIHPDKRSNGAALGRSVCAVNRWGRWAGFLALVFLCSSANAQTSYNFRQFFDETKDFAVLPGKWHGSDWAKIGVIGAGTLLVLQADQTIRTAVLRDRRYYHSVPIEGGRIWGEWYTTLALGVGFTSYGMLADNHSTRKIGYEVIQSALYSQAVIDLLKIPFGRSRPYAEKGAHHFRPFNFQWTRSGSFPGGHASAAFAISTVLSRNAKSDLVKGLCYLPAVCSAVSRVYQDKHWASDCFLGAIIGFTVGTWVVKQHERKELGVSGSNLIPFSISYRFY